MGKKKERGNGEGTIYEKEKGKWIAQVTTGIDPATGKPIRRTIYGKSRSDVAKKMNQILNDLEKGLYVEPAKITLETWLNDWLEGKKPHLTVNTWNMYEGMIRLHIAPLLGNTKLKSLKTRDIQRFLNDKLSSGRKKDSTALSPTTVKHIHQTLNTALRQAVRERVIPFNPAECCELTTQKRKEMKVLEPEELSVFFKTAQEKSPHFTAFYFKVATGMRRGELLGLTWACVNYSELSIKIKQQVINGEDLKPVITDLKTTKSQRTVNIDADTAFLPETMAS